MRIIPGWLHGVDYVIGLLVLASPWLFGFAGTGPVGLHVFGGVVIVTAAAMTDFELGLIRVVPMPVHLAVDVLVGLVALATPRLLDVGDSTGAHLALGVVDLGAAALTSTRPAGKPVTG